VAKKDFPADSLPLDRTNAVPTERSRENERLYKALREVEFFTLRDSVHSDPEMFAEAIFPAMFPAIKRAISAFFEEMVQSFNSLLDKSFSIRGIRWRLEAWRSGKTFAEVALLHSLTFCVEMVVLIQHHTGFLLDHVATGNTRLADPETISAMITAVQDFIQDSIRQKLPPGSGGTLQFGDYTVWTVQGSQATIAAFLRGHAPAELRETLQSTLHQIQRQYWRELESSSRSQELSGQTANFLRQCLSCSVQPIRPQSNPSRYMPIALLFFAALILVGLSYLKHSGSYGAYLKLISNTPGLVVLGHENIPGGKIRIFGLRDQYATDFGTLEAKSGVDSNSIVHDFKPFISEEPPVLAKRIAALLHSPPGVQVHMSDQKKVELIGSAPIQWIQRAKQKLESLDGWLKYDLSRLEAQELLQARNLKRQIEEQFIPFARGSTEISPSAEVPIRNVIKYFVEIERLLKSLNYSWTVQIQGHADKSGEDDSNFVISDQRAESVENRILQAGIQPERTENEAFGSFPFPVDKSGKLGTARWVTFKVNIFEEGSIPYA
jgi:OOP family OmpA-OmpF porin